MTDYVTTRWYRAPELLLGIKTYTSAIDVWSLGCLIAEIVLKKAILRGEDSI
jgi:mitogen-activated protein kinase 1/3